MFQVGDVVQVVAAHAPFMSDFPTRGHVGVIERILKQADGTATFYFDDQTDRAYGAPNSFWYYEADLELVVATAEEIDAAVAALKELELTLTERKETP